MKCAVNVRLSKNLVERLKAAAARAGATRTAMIEAALADFLEREADGLDSTGPAATLQRLRWMSRQLEQLERDLRIVNETVALHARYHLTVTPQVRTAPEHAACALGRERFEAFAAQVGTRVHLGLPLMRETIERLGATRPELFPSDFAQALGGSGAGKARGAGGGPQDCAAAGRGGSVPEDGEALGA